MIVVWALLCVAVLIFPIALDVGFIVDNIWAFNTLRILAGLIIVCVIMMPVLDINKNSHNKRLNKHYAKVK